MCDGVPAQCFLCEDGYILTNNMCSTFSSSLSVCICLIMLSQHVAILFAIAPFLCFFFFLFCFSSKILLSVILYSLQYVTSLIVYNVRGALSSAATVRMDIKQQMTSVVSTNYPLYCHSNKQNINSLIQSIAILYMYIHASLCGLATIHSKYTCMKG